MPIMLALLWILAACAAPAPEAPMNREQARLHCQAVMYHDRATRGRSAPNWNLYDYCMRRYDGDKAAQQGPR
jgi:hypothetical protein